MRTQDYKVTLLSRTESKEINGGDNITQAVFAWFGRLVGHLNNMDSAESEHGATGAW